MVQIWDIGNQATVCKKERKNNHHSNTENSDITGICIIIMSSSRIIILFNQVNVIQSLGLNKNVWAYIWLNDVSESQSSLH